MECSPSSGIIARVLSEIWNRELEFLGEEFGDTKMFFKVTKEVTLQDWGKVLVERVIQSLKILNSREGKQAENL